MDNLQYLKNLMNIMTEPLCFKPYYKWITFNILNSMDKLSQYHSLKMSFKPYYKWITFNIEL